MAYQIKISGIDANQNKHIWLNIDDVSNYNISDNFK